MTPGDVFSLPLGHSEAMAGLLKKCKEAKDGAQRRFPLTEKEGEEITVSVLTLKGQVELLLVGKESSTAVLVASGAKSISLDELLSTEYEEFESFRVEIAAI